MRPALDAIVERALETSRPFLRRELALRPVNGEGELIVDCVVAPYEESTAPAVLIEISDATQHQRITRETALLTQIDGSRLMIRQLAHEIKNPLGGLRGAAQLLARELADASHARIHVGHHQRSGSPRRRSSMRCSGRDTRRAAS